MRPEGVTSARSGRGGDAVAVALEQARVAMLEPSRRVASTAWAVAVATARLCGCTVRESPVRSITPSTAPVSGSWIGAARARPALDRLVEVLGAEDLDGVVGGERGADRVRARAGLAPQHALGEVHVGRRAQAHGAAPSMLRSMPSASLTTIR